jgi:transcriptional regulator with XRE-family HTH domain
MRTRETLLRAVGQQIRDSRGAAELTQAQLGKRSGIVGKYVSEIERGTRDLPLSTLQSVVERGLGFRLDILFSIKNGSRPNLVLPPLPAQVEEVARLVAALPADQRHRVLAIVRSIAALVVP